MYQLQSFMLYLNDKGLMSEGIQTALEEFEAKEAQKIEKSLKIPFGKHKGRSVAEMANEESGLKYLKWLKSQGWFEKFEDLNAEIDSLL